MTSGTSTDPAPVESAVAAAGTSHRQGSGRVIEPRKVLLLMVTAVTVSAAVLMFAAVWTTVDSASRVGADFRLYLDATQRTIAGGGLYPERQLAGPYELQDGDILYPPPILLLMWPFTILPAITFWLVPLIVIAAVVVRHRPALWSWPLVALCFAYPVTSLKIVHGNPTMWIVAAIALGTLTAGPAVLVLLKPTLAPFAIIGANRRRWWIALSIAVVVAALFAPFWTDYVAVVANARGRGVLYSLDEVPFALVPVLAWIASPAFSWRRLPERVANHKRASVGDNRPAR